MSEETVDNFKQAAQIQLIAALQFKDIADGLGAFKLAVNTLSKAIFQSAIVIERSIKIPMRLFSNGLFKMANIIPVTGNAIGRFGIALRELANELTGATGVYSTLNKLEKEYSTIRKGAKAGFEDEAGKLIGGTPSTVKTQGAGGLLKPFFESLKDMKSKMGAASEGARSDQAQALMGSLQTGAPRVGKLPSPRMAGLKAGLKSAPSVLGGLGKSMMGGMASLGPQMLALTLVMKPLSALMEGIMEPLEPLIDLFGMVGEVIGLLLVPIVQALMEALLPIMPMLIAIVMALMPLIKASMIPLMLLGDVMTATMPILTGIIGMIGDFISFLNPIIDFVTGFADILSGGFGNFVTTLFDSLRNWAQGLVDDFGNWISRTFDDFVDGISDIMDLIIDKVTFWN